MATAFKEALASGKFVVTSEVAPPKGTDLTKLRRDIDLLKDRVDGINVTDHQSSVMRYPSLGGCLAVSEQGGEPIMQMTCRDRNRIALEADLLFAYSRGVRNVLCLTGDAVPVGDHKEAMGVFDLDSLQLLYTIHTLMEGHDLGGNELDGPVEFCAGAIVTPEANPIEPQLIKFEKKIAAGAEFFQTQAIYDLDNFAGFMKKARRLGAKVLAGIVLLSSARMAKYMTQNVPGIFVPDSLIEILSTGPKEEMLARGIAIAGRTIATLKKERLCDGVHIMAIGKEEVVPDILAAAGL
jgi:methylenetetrahydrofolate reductase (NADPH)